MPDTTEFVGPIVQIESLRSSGVPARLGTSLSTPCAALCAARGLVPSDLDPTRSSSGICSGPVAGLGPGTACSQSLAPRRTDRTTHTWGASAGEIAPTLGSDLIVRSSSTPARICFNHQACSGTDTVSPCLLTAPFNRFGKLMATCFKRQIQTSADISPMRSKTMSLPDWALTKEAGWALRPRLGGCSLSGVVWCGVA